jgi:hypothetical protein
MYTHCIIVAVRGWSTSLTETTSLLALPYRKSQAIYMPCSVLIEMCLETTEQHILEATGNAMSSDHNSDTYWKLLGTPCLQTTVATHTGSYWERHVFRPQQRHVLEATRNAMSSDHNSDTYWKLLGTP